jgi:hypothetical protein
LVDGIGENGLLGQLTGYDFATLFREAIVGSENGDGITDEITGGISDDIATSFDTAIGNALPEGSVSEIIEDAFSGTMDAIYGTLGYALDETTGDWSLDATLMSTFENDLRAALGLDEDGGGVIGALEGVIDDLNTELTDVAVNLSVNIPDVNIYPVPDDELSDLISEQNQMLEQLKAIMEIFAAAKLEGIGQKFAEEA